MTRDFTFILPLSITFLSPLSLSFSSCYPSEKNEEKSPETREDESDERESVSDSSDAKCPHRLYLTLNYLMTLLTLRLIFLLNISKVDRKNVSKSKLVCVYVHYLKDDILLAINEAR